MKRIYWIITLIPLLLLGCATYERNTYNTIGVTVVTVDQAMVVWGDYVRSGKATAEQETVVRSVYEKYQTAMRAVRVAISIGDMANNRASFERVLDQLSASRVEIIDLIQTLTKK